MGGGLEALLGGGGGPPPGGPAPGGVDPLQALGGGSGPPPPDQSADTGGGDVSSMLKDMLEIARGYIEQEDDEQNKLTMEKITTLIQQVLASEEKELQDAMGGKMSPKLLSRAYAGS